MIFCTNFSGTVNRPSPRYDPAGIPTDDDGREGATDDDGRVRYGVDDGATTGPNTDGGDGTSVVEKTGSQDMALVDGRGPRLDAAPP